jgi:hypothetical protein
MKRHFPALALLVLALVAGLTVIPAVAQEEQEPEEPAFDESFLQTEPSAEIDAFLEDELEVLAGEGATYEPDDRRDPFVSLVKDPTPPRGSRCPDEGIPGLRIDSIEVTGIYITGQGAVAQVRVADRPQSFLIREGDQLCDGEVQSIAFDEVVFKQQTNEGLKPFRDVVKKLKPQGGVGS